MLLAKEQFRDTLKSWTVQQKRLYPETGKNTPATRQPAPAQTECLSACPRGSAAACLGHVNSLDRTRRYTVWTGRRRQHGRFCGSAIIGNTIIICIYMPLSIESAS